ncbi:unnamed protein product, partial [Choristocarpus tenellus]
QPLAYRNSTFAISSVGDQGSAQAPLNWDDELLKLRGPELARLPLSTSGKDSARSLEAWLMVREWASDWTKPGTGLTTPVRTI